MAENIIIEAKNITLNKKQKSSLFENEVRVETKDGYIIKSELADYNKESGILILKKNIIGNDSKNNIIKADFAKYNENTKIFLTIGPTEIITSESYLIESADITLNNSTKQISSKRKTLVTDLDKNKIFVDNFEYQAENDIFKSIGNIEVIDNKQNKYLSETNPFILPINQ